MVTGFSVSAAGSWAYNVGLAVYVYQQTHSAAWVGAVTIGRFVPSVVFGSYGGVVAERFEQVRLMVTLDLSCTVLMAGLTVVATLHGSAWLAICTGAANSVLAMAYQPAMAAVTPQLVPEDDLAAANALKSTVANVAIIAGPAIGALLLLAGSPAFAFGANALSFLWSAAVISRVKTRSKPVDVTAGGSAGPLRQMVVGARAILSSPTATVLAAYSVVASFVYGTDTVLFVVVSQRRLGTGAKGYSYLLAGLGLGGVLAASLVKRISARPRLGRAILAAMAVYCLPTLLLLVVRQPAIAFAVEVVRGGGTLVVDVLAMTALQRSLPKEKLGRVFGAFFAVALSAIALGALVTPPVLDATGLVATLWLSGCVIPALCLIGWPLLRRMDTESVRYMAEISPRLSLLQQAAILAESSQVALESLAGSSLMVELGPGTDVVREGEEADALYVIGAGSVLVHAHGEGTTERQLASLGPGDCFGEIGLIEHIPRTATVTTTSLSRLLRVDGPTFVEVLSAGRASPSLLEGAQARLAQLSTNLPGRAPAPGSLERPA